MSTKMAQQPPFHITARGDGMFVVFDRDQKQRFKAPTRTAADEWIAAELARRQPQRRTTSHV